MEVPPYSQQIHILAGPSQQTQHNITCQKSGGENMTKWQIILTGNQKKVKAVLSQQAWD